MIQFSILGGIVDRTFQVGSPPSSSGGSMGSESEMMRRALIMGGIEGIVDSFLFLLQIIFIQLVVMLSECYTLGCLTEQNRTFLKRLTHSNK